MHVENWIKQCLPMTRSAKYNSSIVKKKRRGDGGRIGIVYYCCWEGILARGGIVLHFGGRSGCLLDSLTGQKLASTADGVCKHEASRVSRGGSDSAMT